ncbi:DUF4097 family beta strand repeat-containing protein [Adhaeribacter rhizoryzae]|uniref:DUF4097 domain-containing protein n=1 Tax=Adhaeribacter rhizoryzae TaxID=2607907 RepID=A0A5M6DPV2_9BACT|nr:DUF4097 family beta strand repeat-containing protein [Adhaeribacter rhizoryzae]KAA5548272.1 hypothetical protein F0145_05970 [Adhaeribacter rhizoryzae]
MKKHLLLIMLWSLATLAWAQSQTETINKTAGFKNAGGAKVLSVENIHGFVHVEAYNGNTVELVAEKEIKANNQQEVAKGMQEVQVKLIETADSIYVYLDAPFIFRKKSRGRNMNINLDDIKYKYQVDMTLRVPAKINLALSTVTEGDVTVTGVTGDLKIRNVNGPLKLTNVAGKTDASTVNGRIDIFYAGNPPADSEFKTVNGNINVHYAPNLNATVSFKSLNGQFYTDLNDVEMMPVQVIKNSEGRGSGTVYKIDKKQNYQVGKGGPALRFETLNGNIYLKKKES